MIKDNRYLWSQLKTRKVTVRVEPGPKSYGYVLKVTSLVDTGKGSSIAVLSPLPVPPEMSGNPKPYTAANLEKRANRLSMPRKIGNVNCICTGKQGMIIENVHQSLLRLYKEIYDEDDDHVRLERIVVDVLTPGDLVVVHESAGQAGSRKIETLRITRNTPVKKVALVMLYNLLVPLADQSLFFNLFQYLTFRTGGAVMTSLLICFIIGPMTIRMLKRKQKEGQPIRDDGPETHFAKAGTPTMGGLMILVSVTASTLLWANLSNPFVWYALLVMVGYGGIGAVDDYLKLTKRNHKGLPGKMKILFQIIIGLVAAFGIMESLPGHLNMHIAIPFFKDYFIFFSWFFIPWVLLVLIGSSNAVNLTDGLDGLAIVPVSIAASCFALISYLVGNIIFADYLNIPYVAGTGELAILCGALVGGAMGFLWFNAPPAMVFMGDTGSLAMGGVLGAIAVMTKHELVLAIIGGLFVLETVSVIVQVVSFKLTGKRVFAMAPLHHHFEKKGWSEPTIVIRFWIIAVILALIGLATLKLR